MPQKFSARAVTVPNIQFDNSGPAANTFWSRAQKLNKFDPLILRPQYLRANKTKLCGFCRACFHGVPETGDTKRTSHQSGLKALLRSAKYCPLCSFFRSLVSQKCGSSVFQDNHAFTVYTRKNIAKRLGDRSLLHIGFQIRTRCTVTMAFCPESNAISTRPIWCERKPDLLSRARLFRTWLEQCECRHDACNKYDITGHPSRILEINPSTSPSSVRLLSLEATLFHGRYAALSHRWPAAGCSSSLTTTNFKQYQESIPISWLPKNFVNAIEITKALGLKHLWIDSLCIVQDDEKDWQSESSKIDIVYLNAVVTIAACIPSDADRDASLNLLQPACLRLSLPTGNAGKGSYVKGTLRSTYASQFTIHDSPLGDRGWVLQEMALSSRILHFTQGQAYWQCRERVESEDGTLCIPCANSGPNQEESLDQVLLVPNTIPENDLPHLWWSWAVDYSSRKFTKKKDKLYAYAGITRFFQRLSGSSGIVLGLLRQRLLTDLTWEFKHDGRHDQITETNLPSWSWLRWDAALLPTKQLFVEDGWPKPAETTILSVEVVWSGQELTTPLERAEIKLLGRLTTMMVSTSIMVFSIERFSVESLMASLEFPPGVESIEDTSKTVTYSAKARFDSDIPHGGSTVYCLEMETFWKTTNIELMSASNPPWSCVFQVTQKVLILRPVDLRAGIFERLGIGTIIYEDTKDWSTAFEDLSPQIITLV